MGLKMNFRINLLIFFIFLSFGQINSQISLELEEFVNWGKYSLKQGKEEIGYIIFSSSDQNDGMIDMFYISPKFRGTNLDLFLMTLALNKLFNEHRVVEVSLFAKPFEYGKSQAFES